MGGMGSGGHNQRLCRLEQCRKLDAAILQRRGLLRNGAEGTVQWTLPNGEQARIAIEGGQHSISLKYKAKMGTSDVWQLVSDYFPIAWSPRHFGGAQAYLTCCACDRRARFLYFKTLRFRCRTCHGLVNTSSQERAGDRATRKNQKLRQKLGAPLGLGDFVPRPKGMHRATYGIYLQRIKDAEQEVWDDAARFLKRLKGADANLLQDLRDNSFWT